MTDTQHDPAEQTRAELWPARAPKPRRRGLTMVIDFGPDVLGWTGPSGIEDYLAAAGEFIDHAKVYAMNAVMLPSAYVRRAVALYRDHGIKPFAGGLFLEYARREGKLDTAIEHLKRLELTGAEISENYVSLTDQERADLMGRLRDDGFEIVYEFGRKVPDGPLDPADLERLAAEARAKGADHVLIEQGEIEALKAASPEGWRAVANAEWFRDLVIEASYERFPAHHAELIETFGPEVNLANVAPGQVMRLEGLRRGLGRSVDYPLFRNA